MDEVDERREPPNTGRAGTCTVEIRSEGFQAWIDAAKQMAEATERFLASLCEGHEP